MPSGTYEIVEASTEQALGTTGRSGDYLDFITVIPLTTSPGSVTVTDRDENSPPTQESAVVFAGGASSVSNLAPFCIPIGANSRNGAWYITTGANVRVWAKGRFF